MYRVYVNERFSKMNLLARPIAAQIFRKAFLSHLFMILSRSELEQVIFSHLRAAC